MTRRSLSLALSVCLMLSIIPVISFAEQYLPGDVNFNGIVNTADATLILKKAAGMEAFTNLQNIVGDVNGNGIVNTADATQVLKIAAGILPVPEPTEIPVSEPTMAPTEAPTSDPTEQPTDNPTQEPTEVPTGEPTEIPTGEPTSEPTAEPTQEPTPTPVINVFITYYDSLNELKVGTQTIEGGAAFITEDILDVPEGYRVEDFNLNIPAQESVTVNVYPYELVDGYDYKIITTEAGLRNIEKDMYGNYYLGADIDFHGNNWKPIGWDGTEYNSPQHPFKGTFDGRGHILNDLYIDFCASSQETRFSNVGLFATNDGTIENLIVFTNLSDGEGDYYYGVFGDCNVGAVCGANNGTVSSCRVYGYNGSMDRWQKTGGGCGGICGVNYGTIQYCSFEGMIDALYSAGGIAGKHYGNIHECYFAGSINASFSDETLRQYQMSYIGGICGYSKNSEIYDCYAYCTGDAAGSGGSGQIAGYQGIGGIAGAYDGGRIRNCWAANMMIYYTLDAGYIVGMLPNGEASIPSEQSGLFYYTDLEYAMPDGYSADVWNLDNVALLQLPDLNRCPRNATFYSVV